MKEGKGEKYENEASKWNQIGRVRGWRDKISIYANEADQHAEKEGGDKRGQAPLKRSSFTLSFCKHSVYLSIVNLTLFRFTLSPSFSHSIFRPFRFR